jgi:dienelactone hydrolase
MGWSHGGAAALEASAYHAGRKADVGEKPAFRAAVAFYPSCSALDYQTQTPTLMLLAENDDWTPPEQCVTKGERARQQGLPISWEIYPNALHAFDRPAPPTTYLGHSMAYDGKAAAASRESVRRFLEKYLQEKH